MTSRGNDIWLALGMLALGLTGALVGVLRAVLLEGPRWWSLLAAAPALLAPLGIVTALVVWTRHRTTVRLRVAATWGGWAAALAAAGVGVATFDPDINRDANIGAGIYTMFGWVFPLGPVALLGALAGQVWEHFRPASSAPATIGKAGPLGLWLLGLVLPALTVAAGEFTRTAAFANTSPRFAHMSWQALPSTVLFTLLTDLGPLLLPLVLLRVRVAQTGRSREKLWGFWGLSLGWTAGILGMYCPALAQSRGFVVLYPLTALLMALGYLGGKQLARRRS
jgi:hypothetical protein